MKPRSHVTGVVLGLVLLCGGRAAWAGTPRENETRAMLRALEDVLDVRALGDSKGPMEFLTEKLATRAIQLSFYINPEAFPKGSTARQIVDGTLPLRMPLLPPRMSGLALLRVIASQIDEDATFLVRQGVVEFVPAKQATPAFLLQSKVACGFTRESLEEVVQTLSWQTGATIVIDARAEEKSRTPITATFRNDATLEAALRMVTEMAQLKLVVMPGGLFVTTPAHAEALSKEARGS
jgi:hypothetical protein